MRHYLLMNLLHTQSVSQAAIDPQTIGSLNYKTGVDLADRSIAFTNINAVRDLHCWEMKFTWVPFGSTRSYLVGINLKSQQFRQVKAQRRRNSHRFLSNRFYPVFNDLKAICGQDAFGVELDGKALF